MKNLTVAIFLALLFCAVSGAGEETADGFQQNPEYAVPASDKPDASVPQQKEPSDNAGEKTDVPVPQQKTAAVNSGEKAEVRNRASKNRESHPNRGTASQRRSTASAQVADNRYGGDLELQDWERRNSPVPTSLPKVLNTRPKVITSPPCQGILRRRERRSTFRYQIIERSGSCTKTTTVVRSCCGK